MKFPSHLEAGYQADLGPEQLRVLRLTSALGCLLYFLFSALDYWTLPSSYVQAWEIRAAVIALTLTLRGLTKWRPQFVQTRYTLLVGGMYVVWGLGNIALISLSKPGDLAWNSYYCGIMLVCAALTVNYLTIKPILTVVATIFGVYLAVAIVVQDMLSSHTLPLLMMNCFFIFSSTIIALVVAHIRERYTRELYLLRHELHQDLKMTQEAKCLSDYRAEHDMLTDMPNRILFMRQLDMMLKQADTTRSIVGIFFIDLNDFKPINDRLGHPAGDMVLKSVSQRIRACVRSNDLAARIGGDEFVVAVEFCYQDIFAINRIWQNLGDSIAKPLDIEGNSVTVTASIGMAMYPFDTDDATKLLRIADWRMYDAKRKDKNQLDPIMPALFEQGLNGFCNAMDSQAT